MARTASTGGSGDFHLTEEGTHIARFCSVIDIGTVTGDFGPKRTAILGWEICSDEPLEEDARPDRIFQRVNWSMNEKAKLRAIIQGMIGKKLTEEEANVFDIYGLAEKALPCMLQVIHNEKNGKTYANYAGVTGLPKGMKAPPLRGSVTLFDLDAPDDDVFGEFGENLKKTIEASPEWQQRPLDKRTQRQPGDERDNAPF